MKRPILTSVAIAAATIVAAPVLACGGEPVAENLSLTGGVKAKLRATFASAHPGTVVAGPRTGAYYGRIDGDLYAVARFQADRRERTVIFLRHPNGGWRAIHETGGAVCSDYVPAPLIARWWLVHTHGRCFTTVS
jgi:hypothetical protein